MLIVFHDASVTTNSESSYAPIYGPRTERSNRGFATIANPRRPSNSPVRSL